MPSFLPEGDYYSAWGDTSLFYIFLPLFPAGLELWVQTLLSPLMPQRSSRFGAGCGVPACRGMLQRTTGCWPPPPRSSRAMGWQLCCRLEALSLAWIFSWQSQIHLA